MKEVLTNNQRYLIEKLNFSLNYLDFEKDNGFYIKPYCSVWVIVQYSLFGDGIILNIKLSRKRKKIRAFAEYSDIIMSPKRLSMTKIERAIDILCFKFLDIKQHNK